MNIAYKALLYSIFLSLLSACGFHLRGMVSLPPSFQHVYIIAPPNGRSLQLKLEEQLQAYRVQRSTSLDKAAFQIIIDSVSFNRQISNISSSTTPRQFQLSYVVAYHLMDSHNGNIIPRGQAVSNRLVSMNSERLLGSNYEQEFFMHEMEEDIATQILLTINHYFTNQS
jgi:LPS-assembly lipoprotein